MDKPINTIIQWNINGFHNNINNLESIIHDNRKTRNFYIICLQEIKTDAKDPKQIFKLNGYIPYFKEDHSGTRRKRGSGILIQKNVIHNHIQIDTSYNPIIEATCIQVFDPIPFSIVNIYIPPKSVIPEADFQKLFDQIPKPVLFVGDFNAHSALWDNNWTKTPDRAGQTITDFIQNNDLIILNDGSETLLHTSKSTSAIDLTIASPSIALDFKWKTSRIGLDHAPIFITPNKNNFKGSFRPQYLLNKANWQSFNDYLSDNLSTHKNSNNPINMEIFSKAIVNAAEKSIPKTTHSFNHKSKPWWNSELKKIHTLRKRASRKVERSDTPQNRANLSHYNSLFRKMCRKSREECWIKFIQSIDFKLDIRQAWQTASRILGKPRSPSITAIFHNNNYIFDPKTIANTMANFLETTSSSNNYSPEFLQFKTNFEQNFRLNIDMSNNESYNHTFSMIELDQALSNANGQSLGPDGVHYAMIKNMDINIKVELLKPFNHYWESGEFPEDWRVSYNIALTKPGKDPKLVENLRFIALSSNLAKTFERMVNYRLQFILNKDIKLLHHNQSGFRTFRQTYDNIAFLEHEINHAFQKKQQVAAVFFDLKKAYDVTWRPLILSQLHKSGIDGRILKYIQNFLSDRKFQIQFENTLSELKTQENGVPQGSVLSVTLFQIAVNTVFDYIPQNVHCLAYADDLVIISRNYKAAVLQNILQETINNLTKWCQVSGFNFSIDKCSYILFTAGGRRSPQNTITFSLSNIPLTRVTQVRFLGMIIDHTLSWRPHIEKVRTDALKGLQLFKLIASSKYIRSRSTLIALHQALILSRLEYGNIIYGSSAKSWLQRLDSIHASCLRSISGAHIMSYHQDLYIDNSMESLSSRRTKHSIAYITKILSMPQHPLFKRITEEANANFINTVKKPFTYRACEIIKNHNIERNPAPISHSTHPTWCLKNLEINTSMRFTTKSNMNPTIVRNHLISIRNKYNDHVKFFTDGSRIGEKTGFGCYNHRITTSGRLPNNTSVFTAEMHAILAALRSGVYAHKIAIFTDSFSAVQTFANRFSTNPIAQQFFELLGQKPHIATSIIWIPSHMDIPENDKADELARNSLNLQPITFATLNYDNKGAAMAIHRKNWQEHWSNNNAYHNNTGPRQMYQLHPTTTKWVTFDISNRNALGKITRLRHGCTYLTHEHIIKRTETPRCPGCNDELSIRHILDTCPAYDIPRAEYNINMFLLCGDDKDIISIIKFLKDDRVNLWSKI